MKEPNDFSFSDDSVAGAYDDVLVPILFEPWAEALIDADGPWGGKRVLDLATGTGIVARLLADRVGPSGSVIGTDLNAEMLKVAAESISSESRNVIAPAFSIAPAPKSGTEITSSFRYG